MPCNRCLVLNRNAKSYSGGAQCEQPSESSQDETADFHFITDDEIAIWLMLIKVSLFTRCDICILGGANWVWSFPFWFYEASSSSSHRSDERDRRFPSERNGRIIRIELQAKRKHKSWKVNRLKQTKQNKQTLWSIAYRHKNKHQPTHPPTHPYEHKIRCLSKW